MEAPVLPRAIASFGAATTDGYLYVFGGHVGRAHQHSRDNLVGSFWRLNLHDGQSWEQLPDGASPAVLPVSASDGLVILIQ